MVLDTNVIAVYLDGVNQINFTDDFAVFERGASSLLTCFYGSGILFQMWTMSSRPDHYRQPLPTIHFVEAATAQAVKLQLCYTMMRAGHHQSDVCARLVRPQTAR